MVKIQKTFIGEVVSAAMEKTIVVKVLRTEIHSKYQKRRRTSKRYPVHVEDSEAYAIGTHVRFVECRPLSKTKRWRVVGMI